jgi:uncharacterized protein
MDPGITEGIHLFNARKFFEAHEALEAVWLSAQGEERIFLHGLIQVAAAFHHHARGNPAGFRSLLEKGAKKLETFPAAQAGVRLGELRRQLQLWRDYARHSDRTACPRPPWPRISKAAGRDE